MSVDLSKLSFFSGVNYLKRSTDLVGNSLLALAGGGAAAEIVINHNLGYIPFFQVGADLTDDGTIWANDLVNEFTETSLSGYNPPYPTLGYYIDEFNLTIVLINNTSPASTGSRRVWWAIYLDYGSTL